jgi:hypothetical protein
MVLRPPSQIVEDLLVPDVECFQHRYSKRRFEVARLRDEHLRLGVV